MVLGIVFSLETLNFVTHSREASGEIVELVESRDGSRVNHFPKFRFNDDQQTTYTVRSTLGNISSKYEVGQTVRVLYDPEHPNDAKIYSFSHLWFNTFFFVSFGVLLVIVVFVIRVCIAQEELETDK